MTCAGVQEVEIVRMERAVMKVMKERAALLVERRRQDIVDMDRECAAQTELRMFPTYIVTILYTGSHYILSTIHSDLAHSKIQ